MINLKNYYLKLDLQTLTSFGWKLTVFVSAFKNLLIWKFTEYEDINIFIFPLFSDLEFYARNYTSHILFSSIASLIFIFSKNKKISAIPFLINGLANLILQFFDYLSLHHDMLFSSLLFITYSFYLYLDNNKSKYILNQAILAIVSSTYLITGIYKINKDFLTGEIIETILRRAEIFPYWIFLEPLINYKGFLAYFAMILEILIPVSLIFVSKRYTGYISLTIFPLHFFIIITATATIYNLLYVFCLTHIHLFYNSNFEYKKLNYIYKFAILIFLLFGVGYLCLMFIFTI